MIFKYNGKSAFVEQINDKPVIRFRDLTRLSVNPNSSLYSLLTKKQDELCGEIIKKNHRSTYITLEGSIKLLNFCRDPDDGLIMEIERFLNSGEKESVEPEHVFVSLKLGEIENKIDAILSTLKRIDLRILSLEDSILCLKKEEKVSAEVLPSDIGKLCRFWDRSDDDGCYEKLQDIQSEDGKYVYLTSDGYRYLHCRRLNEKEKECI